MTLRLLLLAVAAPLAMRAQLTMLLVTTTPNGPVESPAPAAYNFGNVASGDQAMVRLRARNIGIAPVTVTILRVFGTDFALLNTPSTPYTIAAGDFLDVRRQLLGGRARKLHQHSAGECAQRGPAGQGGGRTSSDGGQPVYRAR